MYLKHNNAFRYKRGKLLQIYGKGIQIAWKWNGMELETNDFVNQLTTVCNKSKQRNDFKM